jgi:hypothetical protein
MPKYICSSERKLPSDNRFFVNILFANNVNEATKLWKTTVPVKNGFTKHKCKLYKSKSTK